jgi:hypothetical protein
MLDCLPRWMNSTCRVSLLRKDRDKSTLEVQESSVTDHVRDLITHLENSMYRFIRNAYLMVMSTFMTFRPMVAKHSFYKIDDMTAIAGPHSVVIWLTKRSGICTRSMVELESCMKAT